MNGHILDILAAVFSMPIHTDPPASGDVPDLCGMTGTALIPLNPRV